MDPKEVRFKDFPELDRLPEVIKIPPDFPDKLAERNSKGGKPWWLMRKEGRVPGKTKHKRSWFPIEKRLEVASAFCAGITSAVDLEKLTKVPQGTIRQWKLREWWPELLEKIRLEKDEEFDAKFTKVIDKTLDRIVDALDNGDFHMDKLGNLHRKPVNAKDSAIIAAIMVDKRNLLRGKPTSRTASMSDTEHLNKLAAEFRKFAGAKTIEQEKPEELEAPSSEEIEDIEYEEVTDAEETGETVETESQEEKPIEGKD